MYYECNILRYYALIQNFINAGRFGNWSSHLQYVFVISYLHVCGYFPYANILQNYLQNMLSPQYVVNKEEYDNFI